MHESAVTVVIEYRARPDRVERAIAELERLVAIVVREEADCSSIRLLQDAAEPDRLLLDERWTSREAYLGPHFETPHLRAFIATASELFVGPPDIRFFRTRAEFPPS